MVRLQFVDVLGERSWIGPAPYFRFSGPVIAAGPTSEIIGRLSGQSWRVRGEEFAHFAASEAVVLHFEDDDGKTTQPIGPFERFCGASSVTYANGLTFAHLIRRTRQWCDFQTAQRWPHMVITCVGDVASASCQGAWEIRTGS